MNKKISLTAIALDGLKDQVTCPVCLDIYNNPRVLSCHHSLCSSCIKLLEETSKKQSDKEKSMECNISCPTCRADTCVTDGESEELPPAFHLNSLLEMYEQFLKQQQIKEKCLKHNEHLKLLCTECREIICLQCALEDHKGHSHTHIDILYCEYKQEIHECSYKLQQRVAEFETAIEELATRKTEVTRNGMEMIRKINLHSQAMVNKIQETQNKLLEQTEFVVSRKIQALEKQKERVEQLMMQLKNLQDYISSSLTEWNQCKLVRNKHSIAKQVDGMTTSHDTEVFKPIEEANISFKQMQPGAIGDLEYSFHQSQDVIVKPAFVNETTSITIILKNDNGKPHSIPTKLLTAKICMPKNEHIFECNIRQNKPGIYQLHHTPTKRGTHLIFLSIGGVEIKGSPIPFKVKARTDSIGSTINMIHGLKNPWGIDILDDDCIVVVENGDKCLSILGEDGRHKERITIDTLDQPRGVAVLPADQTILVTDNHSVLKVNLQSQCIARYGYSEPGDSSDHLNYPSGIAVQPSTGNIFIADSKNNRVLILNSELKSPHVLKSSLNQPSDITFDEDGYIYVSEYANHYIKVFTPEGLLTGRIGSKGKKRGQLLQPVSIAIHNDQLYVCESGNSRISVFTLNGQFLHFFEEKGSGLQGIAINCHGYIFVSDHHAGRVLIY